MAIQPIRIFGDPVLRTRAAEVTTFDKELRTLVTDLEHTMLDADGAGLAAPQIGVSLRVFTYHVDGVVGHLVNPRLDLSEDLLSALRDHVRLLHARHETPLHPTWPGGLQGVEQPRTARRTPGRGLRRRRTRPVRRAP